MMQPGQPVVITVAAPPTGRRENYASKQALGLNIVQIFLGLTFFVCNIAVMMNGDFPGIFGTGIWAGILVIVAGGIGIGAAKRKSECLIIASMVMSILAALAGLCVTASGSVGLHLRLTFISDGPRPDKNCIVEECTGWWDPLASTTPHCTYVKDGACENRVALNTALVASGVIEMIVATWLSVLCCAVICCKTQRPTHTGYYNNEAQITHDSEKGLQNNN